MEIVFSRKRLLPPPPNPRVTRTKNLKILGITVDNKLTFSEHVKSTVTSCSQSLCALRLLRQHGMPETSIQTVFRASLISKLLYASPSWWGFTSSAVRSQIEAFLRRSKKLCYCNKDCPDSESLADSADICLFKNVKSNPFHVLHPLLPPLRTHHHTLRKRPHNFELPQKDNRNFLNRMLFKNMY